MTELLVFNVLWVMLPTALAGIAHMLVVRQRWAESLAQPIWLDGLGPNKTWRGVVAMSLFSALAVYGMGLVGQPVLPVSQILWGLGLGMLYVLAELPNSYVKRRMGIAAGTQSAQRPWLSAAVDKMDSALLGSVVLALWIPGHESQFGLTAPQTAWTVAVATLAVNSGIHALLSWILVALNLKARF